jgi:hypothetical protein
MKLMCAAVEPFKISQFQEALVVNPETGELTRSPIPKDEIMACCASLAYLERSGPNELILLAHHSVRQFLLASLKWEYDDIELHQGELCTVHLHRYRPVRELTRHKTKDSVGTNRTPMLIQSGIVSAVGSIIAPRLFRLPLPSRSVTIQMPTPVSRHVHVFDCGSFMYYAKQNWLFLTRSSNAMQSSYTKFLGLALFNSRAWWIYPWQQDYISFGSHIAAIYSWPILNHHYALLHASIIDQGFKVDNSIYKLPLYGENGKRDLLPLCAAAEVGDTEIMGLLLRSQRRDNR